jgi:predicted RNase H-like HicB family nuclease
LPTYIALLRKEPDSDYGVDFPDFPGCITAGSTIEEARAMAEEALAFHIEGMREDGDAIPEPSPIDTVMADPHNAGAIAFLVNVPDSFNKVVHVDITMPNEDLRAIDDYAHSHGLTRSGLLVKAARQFIGAE